jgi:hypothetical protein
MLNRPNKRSEAKEEQVAVMFSVLFIETLTEAAKKYIVFLQKLYKYQELESNFDAFARRKYRRWFSTLTHQKVIDSCAKASILTDKITEIKNQVTDYDNLNCLLKILRWIFSWLLPATYIEIKREWLKLATVLAECVADLSKEEPLINQGVNSFTTSTDLMNTKLAVDFKKGKEAKDEDSALYTLCYIAGLIGLPELKEMAEDKAGELLERDLLTMLPKDFLKKYDHEISGMAPYDFQPKGSKAPPEAYKRATLQFLYSFGCGAKNQQGEFVISMDISQEQKAQLKSAPANKLANPLDDFIRNLRFVVAYPEHNKDISTLKDFLRGSVGNKEAFGYWRAGNEQRGEVLKAVSAVITTADLGTYFYLQSFCRQRLPNRATATQDIKDEVFRNSVKKYLEDELAILLSARGFVEASEELYQAKEYKEILEKISQAIRICMSDSEKFSYFFDKIAKNRSMVDDLERYYRGYKAPEFFKAAKDNAYEEGESEAKIIEEVKLEIIAKVAPIREEVNLLRDFVECCGFYGLDYQEATFEVLKEKTLAFQKELKPLDGKGRIESKEEKVLGVRQQSSFTGSSNSYQVGLASSASSSSVSGHTAAVLQSCSREEWANQSANLTTQEQVQRAYKNEEMMRQKANNLVQRIELKKIKAKLPKFTGAYLKGLSTNGERYRAEVAEALAAFDNATIVETKKEQLVEPYAAKDHILYAIGIYLAFLYDDLKKYELKKITKNEIEKDFRTLLLKEHPDKTSQYIGSILGDQKLEEKSLEKIQKLLTEDRTSQMEFMMHVKGRLLFCLEEYKRLCGEDVELNASTRY